MDGETEKQRNCRYCHEGNAEPMKYNDDTAGDYFLDYVSYENAYIDVTRSELVIIGDDYDFVPIVYCPKCGRRISN